MMSAGWVWCSSYSAALGRISFSANSRASGRSSRCSSVRANETPPATPVSIMAISGAPGRRLTSQSTSLEPAKGGGQAPALCLRAIDVWRWHEASGTRVRILEGVDWAVHPGERWALLGPNGAGKTTLLTVAAAVEFPSGGTVEILGHTLGRTDVFRLREHI